MPNEKLYTIFIISMLKPVVNIRKGHYTPSEFLKLKTIICNSTDVEKISKKFLYDFINEQSKIKIGDVVTHSDGGDINHRGVVIDIKNNKALLLICTTNSNWNSKARLATEEELKLFNFSYKDTKIAPIIREIKELYNMNYSFPNYRIENLRKEFGTLN